MSEHIIHQDANGWITEMPLEKAILFREYSQVDGALIAEAKIDTAVNMLLSKVYEIKGGVYACDNEIA